MADEGYMLSGEAVKRTAEAVRRVERFIPGPIDDGTLTPRLPQSLILEARVTGAAINNSGTWGTCSYLIYPAVLLQWDGANTCWNDGLEIFLFDLNAGTLVDERRYTIKLIDSSYTIPSHGGSGTKPLGYVISGGAGGGYNGVRPVARCIDCDTGAIVYVTDFLWIVDGQITDVTTGAAGTPDTGDGAPVDDTDGAAPDGPGGPWFDEFGCDQESPPA